MPKTITKAYKYALFPTEEQAHQIRVTCGCCRYVYNHYISLRKYDYDLFRGYSEVPRRNKRGRIVHDEKDRVIYDQVPVTPNPAFDEELTWFPIDEKNGKRIWHPKAVSKACTNFFRTTTDEDGRRFLYDADTMALRYAYSNCYDAYKNFFRRLKTGVGAPGYPRYKSRSDKTQSYATGSGTQFKIDWDKKRIVLPKLGSVKFDAHVRYEGHINRGTIIMNSDGTYALVLSCRDVPYEPKPLGTREVGVNQGVTHKLVTSDGQVFDDDLPLRRALKKKARLNRRLSRKKGNVKGQQKSKGFYRVQRQIARLESHIANIRREQNLKIANALVDATHTIHMAKPNVQELQQDAKKRNVKTKNGKLSRELADTGSYQLYSMIAYKAAWNDRTFFEKPGKQPVTKTCSACGHVQDIDTTKTRVFVCEACGMSLDIDVNAARNVMRLEPVVEKKKNDDSDAKPAKKTTKRTSKKSAAKTVA